MKISKKWKRFWTLDQHHAEGFTLVELIVVIAILAILGGIGIPAYSGYAEKANKQADMSLASEVAHALELAYYNQKLPEGGYVVLSPDGATGDATPAIANAMEAAFGTGWDTPGNETMSLKYDGWNGEYNGGSFQGNETALLGEVEELTEILADFLKTNADMDVLGGRFGDYMKTELGFSAEVAANNGKVADAAVLYVANTTKNMTDDQKKALMNVGAGAEENPMMLFQNILDDVYGAEYNTETGALESPQNVFVSTATAYAVMAGYYSYIGKADEMPKVSAEYAGSGSSAEMMTMMTNAFGTHFQKGTEKWQEYLEKQYEKDAMAFIDAMSTANSAKGLIMDSLGAPYDSETGTGCFNSQKIKDLFTFYANGEICVIAEVAPDGSLEITMVPEFN
jgi:prepilin-type N-terminal cleavage/methylation domain-containing protein